MPWTYTVLMTLGSVLIVLGSGMVSMYWSEKDADRDQ